jgi:hypothetical protein
MVDKQQMTEFCVIFLEYFPKNCHFKLSQPMLIRDWGTTYCHVPHNNVSVSDRPHIMMVYAT